MGPFIDPVTIGLLKASDYGELDIVSAFIGSIIDQLCGLTCGSIRKTFTLNLDPLSFLHLW